MKKVRFILITAALLAVTAANAQLRFGVKGGVNIAKAKFEKEYFRTDNITGFHLGPTLEAALGAGGIGFDAAVLYSQKGFASERKTVRNAFLEVPVNVKFKLGLPLVNPYVAAGPYVDIRIAGDKSWTVAETAESIGHRIKTKNFGAGLNFSAGAELLRKLQIGITYSLGLTDNYANFDPKDVNSYRGKAHTWSVGATVFF
jgi:hypothetical protein